MDIRDSRCQMERGRKDEDGETCDMEFDADVEAEAHQHTLILRQRADCRKRGCIPRLAQWACERIRADGRFRSESGEKSKKLGGNYEDEYTNEH